MNYRAPVADIAFTLKHIAGLDAAQAEGRFADLSDDLIDAVLAEAGRFAAERIAPLNPIGDRAGCTLADGVVTMPPGWREAYRDWCEGGWNGLTGPVEFGGQGLPVMLSVAVQEMWNAASMAFGIGPMLTIGAIEALAAHGSDALKAIYLEKLVSGAWMGTMNLTEPQAGSDLAALRSRAEPVGDGSYRIFGQKIFITYGEHALTDNIVHFVLARLPNAPAGTRGISLFLVPKFLVNPDGSLGPRNDVLCTGLEHKLGIHGSPTCSMSYGEQGGAIGWVVGEENRGLACMFTMMNNARLAVGVQGVAVAEAAYQRALAYAQERRQGRTVAGTGEMDPIIRHPDVKRMLLTQKALTAAARAICYACAHAIDMSRAETGAEARRWHERASLITPLAKAFSTDIGIEVASIGVQIHGGTGYIEQTGAAQLYRDARIAAIYEGTNGIQSIDLVSRKLPLSGGGAVADYLDELAAIAAGARESSDPDLSAIGERVTLALGRLAAATTWIQATGVHDPVATLAVATPFLRLMSLAAGGAYLAKAAAVAVAAPDVATPGRLALARFYAEHLLGETSSLADRVMTGAASVTDGDSALT